MDKFYQFIIEQREKHMEERDKRDVPEVGVCSFLVRQAVGGKPAHTESKEDRGTGSESTPRLQLPLPDLQLLRLDHAPALLAFERENPASRKVLEHNGFVAGGSLTLNGKLAMSYICELR